MLVIFPSSIKRSAVHEALGARFKAGSSVQKPTCRSNWVPGANGSCLKKISIYSILFLNFPVSEWIAEAALRFEQHLCFCLQLCHCNGAGIISGFVAFMQI